MACLIFKDRGKSLDKCLIKMPPGKTINGITHLKTHKKRLDDQVLVESESNKRELKCKDKD